MEKVTGYSFIWMAATHTDHPHAHLLINGTDKTGKDIRFDKLFYYPNYAGNEPPAMYRDDRKTERGGNQSVGFTELYG
jgi:hypothetical protein